MSAVISEIPVDMIINTGASTFWMKWYITKLTTVEISLKKQN